MKPSTIFYAAMIAGASLMATKARADWYVIVGSSQTQHGDEAMDNFSRVNKAANRCNVLPSVGFSKNFSGMKPGMVVQVLGPYKRRVYAELARANVLPCLKDSFVKETTERTE